MRYSNIVDSATDYSLSGRAKSRLIEYQFRLGNMSFPSNSTIYLEDEGALGDLYGSGYSTDAATSALAGAGAFKNSDSRGMIEIFKIFNNHAHPNSSCSISANEFNSLCKTNRATATDANDAITGRGAFLFGVNFSPGLEEYVYRMTVDAAGQNIQWRYKFASAITTNSLVVNFFLLYEGDLVMDGPTMYVEF